MTTRRIVATTALAALLAIAAAAPADAVTIRGSGTQWRPARVDIDRGDRVRWSAASGNHNVRAYGRNRFFCSIHGDVIAGQCTGMCGKIFV